MLTERGCSGEVAQSQVWRDCQVWRDHGHRLMHEEAGNAVKKLGRTCDEMTHHRCSAEWRAYQPYLSTELCDSVIATQGHDDTETGDVSLTRVHISSGAPEHRCAMASSLGCRD